MTGFKFTSENVKEGLGCTPTHWTAECAKFCTYMTGTFSEDAVSAAKEHFKETFHNLDEGDCEYYDGEELLKLAPVEVSLYGLVCRDGKYFWTGTVKKVTFQLTVSETETE